jgi:hypothetical protein
VTGAAHTVPGQPRRDHGGLLAGGLRPPVALVVAIPGLAAIAIAVAVSAPFGETSEFPATVVSVALGVFGVLLTAVTIVLALVIDVGARWPSLTNLISYSKLPWWFGLAFVAVVLSVIAAAWDKGDFLVIVSLGLSLSGAVFGSWSIYRVLSVSSGTGRHRFLTGLLADALRRERVPVSARNESERLGPYLADVDAAVDARDLDALGARLAELGDAVVDLPIDRLWLALDLVIRLVDRTGRAALLERVDSEVSASMIPDLLITAHSLTDRLAREDPRNEVQASAYLGQLARTLAWLQGAADVRIASREGRTAPMRRLIVTTLHGRRAMASGMHPDPPQRPDPSALPRGLTSARAAVVWLSGFLDFNGSDRGRAMYAFYAAVTGERFLGAYEHQSIVQDADERLYRTRLSNPAAQESRALFGDRDGFRRGMLELAATALAGPRPLARPTPDGLGHERYLSQDLRFAWIHAKLLADHLPDGADRALEDLAYLLSDRGSRVERLVRQEYAPLGRLVFPELLSPAQRPAACVVACALPFAAARSRQLGAFAARLPEPLLRGALEHLERRFVATPRSPAASDPKLGRRAAVRRFVDALQSARATAA